MLNSSVYLHKRFVFHDGTVETKYFVILNNPKDQEPYLIVRTTSRVNKFNYAIGCNPQLLSFFVSIGHVPFWKYNTIIQFDDIYEMEQDNFVKGRLIDKEIEEIGALPNTILEALRQCIEHSKDDIAERHYQLIMQDV